MSIDQRIVAPAGHITSPADGVEPSTYDDVCVVIPMLNEGAVIADVVAPLRGLFSHIVCVDDGSTDDCAGAAAAAGAWVVRHPDNLGQGAALQTGLDFAIRRFRQVRYFVTFDADGQHRVEDALAMVTEARRGEVDVVLGSRFLESAQHVPLARRVLLRAAVSFTRLTTGLRLSDAHNGLRVFTRHAAATLDIRLSGMAHASEILAVVANQQLRYVEMPVHVVYTDYSRRKGQSPINAVNIVFDLLVARARFAR